MADLASMTLLSDDRRTVRLMALSGGVEGDVKFWKHIGPAVHAAMAAEHGVHAFDQREALLGWAGRVVARDRFDPALAEALKSWLDEREASGTWRPNVIKFSQNILKEIRPRAMTRDIDWGIPVPLDGWRDQCRGLLRIGARPALLVDDDAAQDAGRPALLPLLGRRQALFPVREPGHRRHLRPAAGRARTP